MILTSDLFFLSLGSWKPELYTTKTRESEISIALGLDTSLEGKLISEAKIDLKTWMPHLINLVSLGGDQLVGCLGRVQLDWACPPIVLET